MTKVSNTLSDGEYASCRVPHGSILEPQLVIVYINSLLCILLEYVSTFLYADDITLVVSGINCLEVSNSLNEALLHTGRWFRNHKLCLNVGRTNAILFGITQRLTDKDRMPPVIMVQVYKWKSWGSSWISG